MNNHWQSEIFSILDCNHVSMYDLLILTLRTSLEHLGKLSTQQLQWAYYNCDAMLYIQQWDPVSQRLSKSSWCYSNNVLTRQYSTNYTDLPETWFETEYFLNLFLDFLVTLGHSVW